MTSQVGARFFKYEKNYFSEESVGILQHIKRVIHSKCIHKTQTKYSEQIRPTKQSE